MNVLPDPPPGIDNRGAQGVQVGSHNVQHNYYAPAAAEPLVWPIRVGRAPSVPGMAQPRSALRQQIRDGLAGRAAVVLSGDAGRGKTQLAAAALHDELAGGTDLAVWVTGTSLSTVLSGYAQAAATLRVGSRDDVEVDAAAFLDWLAATDKSWLVVVDDLAAGTDLTGWWPPEHRNGHGHLVVTSRRRDAQVVGLGQMIGVDVFGPAEAVDYIATRLTGAPAGALDQADGMAEDLGCLPLALAGATGVILDQGWTCAQYRTEFSRAHARLPDLFPTGPSGTDEHDVVAAAWALSATAANDRNPVGIAAPLAGLIAVLDPNGVPESVLTSDAACAYLTVASGTDPRTAGGPAAVATAPAGKAPVVATAPAGGAPEASGAPALTAASARQALRNLHLLSMVDHDPSAGPRAVRMHALAQRAVSEARRADLVVAVKVAADALLEVWPEVGADLELSQVLRANTAILARRDPDALWQPQVHPVQFRAGISAGEAGLVVQAAEHFTLLAKGCAERLGPDHPDTLAARGHLAWWQGEAGDVVGAVAAFEHVLADRLRTLGADHPDTLTTRGQVAWWRGEAGDPAGAVAACETVLTARLKLLGPDHPDTLTTRGHLARWRGEAGDPAGAAADSERLLADRIRLLGPDHPRTLTSRGQVARWRGEAGDPQAAVAGLTELLEDRIRIQGPDHPHTLTARANLARWRGEAGDPAGAVRALEDVLADRIRILGPDHPHTLATHEQLDRWRNVAQSGAGVRPSQAESPTG